MRLVAVSFTPKVPIVDRAGAVVCRSWSDLAILEARQWFEKEEVFGSQGAAGMRRENSQADQINHDGRDCSEAVCDGSEQDAR